MAAPGEERTAEEGVSQLEGTYEHLATKADVARLVGVLQQIERRLVRWMVAVVVISATVATTVATVLNHLLTAG